MSEDTFQVVKSIGFLIAFALALSIQRWRPHRVLRGSWRVNSTLWGINAVVMGVVCAGCACTVARLAEGNGLGVLNQASFPLWFGVLISLIGLDLTSYVWHRANHRLTVLWRFHQVHHADPDYTVTTAVRFHPGELLLALPIRLAAVAALGAPIYGVIVFEVIFAFANFYVHGNIDHPLAVEESLGRLIVTPALHRRHHSRESRLLNSNYGTILTLWDRLFRSFGESRSDVHVDTGLPGVEGSLGPRETLALPLRGVFRGT